MIKGELTYINHGGLRSKKLTDEHDAQIRAWFDEDATLTLRNLQRKIEEKYQITVCPQTINNQIEGIFYSFKRVTLLPDQWNTPENIEKRTHFAQKFSELRRIKDDNNFIYIDEVGFSIALRRCYGRSNIGEKAISKTQAIRSMNITLVACMSKTGMVLFTESFLMNWSGN